ncbi:MAG: hypothetical protein GDA56_19080 [Hormoscilla sp. GM7CHS1pb]|nr:hypothetical protein [Hormoscilla sp. GM7CHS1pb]
MTKAIELGQSYTFSDYSKLNYYREDIFAYFGYSFQSEAVTLPQYQGQLDRLESLRQRIEESLPLVTLDSEAARREFLIAPVLMDLIHYTRVKVKVSYPLAVNDQLKGALDYYLQSQNHLLVIEAKDENLQRGFTQLGVELIAIDKAIAQDQQPESQRLYGAVSIGNIWQFGFLVREKKQITQDLNLYRVPNDLEDLMGILVAIVKKDEG